jgi:uncharacterized protein YciI
MARTIALTYEYVDGMLERRAPHREAHLAHIARWGAEGRLRVAGALGDPPSGAIFVFEVDDPAEVERFVEEDPYVEAELVTASRIEPLALVLSAPLDPPAA